MTKQSKNTKNANLAKGKSKGSKNFFQDLNIPTYPNSQLIRTDMIPSGIQIIEMVCDKPREEVLAFYKENFAERGWSPFAADQLSDRASLSFHPIPEQTITVLTVASKGNTACHLRVYIQA
jgi:hypothetical protein